MHRLSHAVEDHWYEHSYPPIYEMQPDRVVATVPGSDPMVLQSISKCLRHPLIILYVLHTSRGEGERGRYQSDALSAEEISAFFKRFGDFLRSDGRYDLWLYSPADKATIVWDRHNLLFAYGPLAQYEAALRSLGFMNGKPAVPVPHSHHFREESDADAAALLREFDWRFSPLQEQDEQ